MFSLMHLKVCEMFAFSWVNALSGLSSCSALLTAEDGNAPLGVCSYPQLCSYVPKASHSLPSSKQGCSRSCFLSPVECPGQGTVSYGKKSSKFNLPSSPQFALL